MEQWGAITINQKYLKRVPEQSFPQTLQGYRVVVHEVFHMWIGNLVTMEWWDGLWLKEGFARYFEEKCISELRPQFCFAQQHFMDVITCGYGLDLINPVHAVEWNITDPSVLPRIFDAIVYDKGAAIVKMMESYVGKDLFQRVLREYLLRFQYRSTTCDLFFAVFEEFAGENIREIFIPWIKQKGIPLVSVSQLSTKTYEFSQKVYSSYSRDVWRIPITYYTDDYVSHEFLLDSAKQTLELETPSEWIKLNCLSENYYVVLYDGP